MQEILSNGQSTDSWSKPVNCSQEKSHFRQCFWQGSLDSEDCQPADRKDVSNILHHCCMVLGAYGKTIDDLEKEIKKQNPSFDKGCILKFDHPKSRGACPPYFICVDQRRQEIGMYIRGLNLLHRQDYASLMSSRKDEQEFDGGYVHPGMMEPAKWAFKFVAPILRKELLKYSGYQLIIAGHSLGAGVAALFTLLLLQDRAVIGGIPAAQIKGYAIEPPRVMSMELAHTIYLTSSVSFIRMIFFQG
ncbi:hypothetical protein L7F22_039763 [Adiantum nelumboides]|nr:hypothetical protein [Adiantum nelumboides]